MKSKYFMGFLEIGERKDKPRDVGLTFIGDTGSTLSEAMEAFEVIEDYVDLVKLVMCSGRLSPKEYIMKKVKVYDEHGVMTFPGGVLCELAILRNKYHEFLKEVQEVGCGAVEISVSEMRPLPLTTMCRLVEIAAKDYGFKVLGEIGVHSPKARLDVADTIHEVRSLKESGAWKVIIEGAELLYMGVGKDPRGTRDLMKIVDAVGHEDLIFETQMDLTLTNWLIENFGPDINLGNVCFKTDVEAVLEVEAARRKIIQSVRDARIPSSVLRL